MEKLKQKKIAFIAVIIRRCGMLVNEGSNDKVFLFVYPKIL